MTAVDPDADAALRHGGASDVDLGIAVAVAAGLWDPTGTGPVRELLEAAVARAEGGPIWVVAGPPGSATGTACAQPVAGTDRTWDLTMIGVSPDSHRRGIGSALLEAIESAVRYQGGRLLVLETSSSPAQDAARSFYATHGYDEEGRVRDHWEDGEDMILYRKRLR